MTFRILAQLTMLFFNLCKNVGYCWQDNFERKLLIGKNRLHSKLDQKGKTSPAVSSVGLIIIMFE